MARSAPLSAGWMIAASAYCLAAALDSRPCAILLILATLLAVLTERRLGWLLLFVLGGTLLAIDSEGEGTVVDAHVSQLVEVKLRTIEASDRGNRHVRTPVSITPADRSSLVAILEEPLHHPSHQRGELWQARGWLRAARKARNPGGWAERWPTLEVGAVTDLRFLGTAPLGSLARILRSIERLSDRWQAVFMDHLRGPAASLCCALVLGRDDSLEVGLEQALRNVGAAHFLSVSGVHVAMVGGFTLLILSGWCRRVWVREILAAAVVVGYTLLAGAEAPALRSMLVFLLWRFRKLRGTVGNSSPALAFALLFVATLNPADLKSASLQLSFAAILGLSIASRFRSMESPRATGTGVHLWKPLRRALWYSICATLATAPVASFHFATFAPWSVVTTLLLAPGIAVQMFLGFWFWPAHSTFPLLGDLLAAALQATANALQGASAFCDLLPGTPLYVAPPGRLVVAGAMIALLLLQQQKLIGASVALALTASAHCCEWMPTRDQIWLLDAGHGQVFIAKSQGRVDVVDAGGIGENAIHGRELRNALRSIPVDQVHTLFLSHLDQDHAGLASEILAAACPAEIGLSAAERTSWLNPTLPWQRGLLRASSRSRVRWLAAGDGDSRVEVLWPPEGRSFPAPNERSLVLLLRLSRECVLTCGDLSSYALLEMCDRTRMLATTVVLPHHGREETGLGALLQSTRPIVACASGDRCLDPEVCRTLLEHGVCWIGTAGQGAIELDPVPRHGR